MKTIPKKTAEEIIERLANKRHHIFIDYEDTGQEACVNCNLTSEVGEILENSKTCPSKVMIGDVLKAMRMKSYDLPKDRKEYALKILHHFQRCGGEDLSLQEILEEAEVRSVRIDGQGGREFGKQLVIISAVADLFLFLNEIL